MRLSYCMPLTLALSACSDVRATTKATPDHEDQCDRTSSNLNYTECWQKHATESRSKVEEAMVVLQKAASNSDEREDGRSGWLTETLKMSQQRWTAYSERQCVLEGRVARGGTGTRALIAKCQVRLNSQRIDELTNLFEAIENY